MTARELQVDLVEDLQDYFSGRSYRTPSGGVAPLQVFPQNLPRTMSEDEDDPFPYIVVRLESGSIEHQESSHKIAVMLLIGIYDDGMENNGHELVLEVIEKILAHFENRPNLKEFAFVDPFEWVLQDEQSWPYFFGAVNLNFDAPPMRINRSDLV